MKCLVLSDMIRPSGLENSSAVVNAKRHLTQLSFFYSWQLVEKFTNNQFNIRTYIILTNVYSNDELVVFFLSAAFSAGSGGPRKSSGGQKKLAGA